MSTPAVSIIVITYKRGPELERCLRSIAAQEGLPAPVEVILIDNAGDALVNWPNVPGFTWQVERAHGNLGVAGGRNLGMVLASGELLLFIDDDAEWETHTTARQALDLLTSAADIGAVALRSIRPATGETIVSELPHPDKDYALHVSEPVTVPYFYGVAHGLRASAVQLTGNYPARYFYAMEELDLSLRLYDAGYRIVYDPSLAVIHHHAQAGRPVTGAKYWKNNALNKMRVAWRLLPVRYALSITVIWGARVLQKARSPRALWAVYRALWAERALLREERRPLKPATIQRLRGIGARLVY